MALQSKVVQQYIKKLALEPHLEGGFYRRSYVSSITGESAQGERPWMSSIYYLLTKQANIGHWHQNKSDIMHYFHAGDALTYWLISPQGELEKHMLSNDINIGLPQLLVPKGYWKATHLERGEFGLLSEAVCPAFDFADMTLGSEPELLKLYPQHAEKIKQFV